MTSTWLAVLGAVARGVAQRRIRTQELRVLAAVLACERGALAGITFATIPRTRRWLRRMRRPAAVALGRASQERVLWALDVSARRGVGTCLTRALAAEALLPPSMHPALVIGVAPCRGASRLDAHAWVEVDGRVVVGEHALLANYRPLVVWQPPRPGA